MRISRYIFFSLLAATTCAAASDRSKDTRLSSLPAPAQSRISAVLGRDNRDYHVTALGSGFTAKNSSQRLTASFTPNGIEVNSGTARWGVSLKGYGYGDIRTVTPTAPRAETNRVAYRHGDLTEWYVNGPVGLEQGFTIEKRPGKSNGEPLTIAFTLSGNLTAAVDESGRALRLSAGISPAGLRYAGLTAADADGKELQARLELIGSRLMIRIADFGARYPLTVDPLIQLAVLTASDGGGDNYFGNSVAIDGNTIVIGAIGHNGYIGAAYVFVKPTTGWANMTETAELSTSDQGDAFGASVAISGNTVVVGAYGTTVQGNSNQGSAYVYVEPMTGWTSMTETAELTASDGAAGDQFGQSVAVSGNTVVVGANNATIGSNIGQGAAYVFVKPPSGWTTRSRFNAKLTASEGMEYDYLGIVAINGSTIVAGATGVSNGRGAAYVFTRPSTGWANETETAELTASDGMGRTGGNDLGDCFGDSISMNANTVVIGAEFAQREKETGAVYVFVEPAGGWATTTQTAELTAVHTIGGNLGQSVGIFGNVIIAAAPGIGGSSGSDGEALLYVKPAGGWATTSTFAERLTIAGIYEYGWSVGISGNTVIVGSIGNSGETGVTYVYGP